MISNLGGLGIFEPGGFATTLGAFDQFLQQSGIWTRIDEMLDKLDSSDIQVLAATGQAIRDLVMNADLPQEV